MSWPLLSAALPGSGGRVKVAPEDFVVEEIPAYPTSGEGEHLFLFIEKVGHDTPWVARRLAEVAGISVDDVSYAGMKDRQAVTRQVFSLPSKAEGALAEFAEEGVRILWRARHRNKLRSGHLRGNRFHLRIREPSDAAAGEAVFRLLSARGVPNYFGDQRFGARGDNAEKGKALILGQRLPRAPSRFERRLFLSAYQAQLFNRQLAERVTRGDWDRALEGDVLRKEETGGLFVCAEPEVNQPRVERFEISPAGPLFGTKLFAAEGEILAAETALLATEGVGLNDFRRGGGLAEGARRSYRLRLEDPQCEVADGDLRISFTLPPGSYATVVLEEITKSASEPA